MLLKFALFLHVISAVFWVGGMLFLTLVIVPFLYSMPDPADRSKVYQVVGKKFRLYGWVAIITLLVTGPTVLYLIYGVTPAGIFLKEFHLTGVGKALSIKLTLVTLIVLSSLFHDFYLGPRAKGSPRLSFWARVFGRSNLVIALLIVIFAVIIRVGGL